MNKKYLKYLILLVLTVYSPIVILSQSLSIRKVGEWGSRYYTDIFIKDNYAYCIISGKEFSIIDTGDPANPREVAIYNIGGAAYEVAAAGNYAYIVGPDIGLMIFDVSQPSNPVHVGTCSTFDSLWYVSVDGDFAYVGYWDRLRVIDVSNPVSPVLRGSIVINGMIHGICVKGNYAFVGTGNYLMEYFTSGLHVVDISNPDAPTLAGVYDTGYWNDILALELTDNYAFLLSFYELIVLDVSDPSNLFVSGVFNFDSLWGRSGVGLSVKQNYAYIGIHLKGLEIVDISQPSSPVLAGTYNNQNIQDDVVVTGNYAYARYPNGGFGIVDISGPSSPSFAGAYDNENTGIPANIYTDGKYAYLSDHYEGLKIIDISVPASPRLVGSYSDSTGMPQGMRYDDVFVFGKYAYLKDSGRGLKIIDISTPSSPVPVGQYDYSNVMGRIFVSGNYAYLCLFEKGLRVLNVSNPAAPKYAGQYKGSSSINGVYVAGNHAYVTGSGEGLKILDISTPSSPVLVGQCETVTGSGSNPVVSGHYVYLTAGDSIWEVMDVSDVTAPKRLSHYKTSSLIYDLYVKDHYLFMAGGSGGLTVYDISDPEAVFSAGGYNTEDYARDVSVSGNYVFLLDGRLSVFRFNASSSFPSIALSRTQLNFASDNSGAGTGVQSVRISSGGGGNLNWSVSSTERWVDFSPAYGNGSGEVYVSVDSKRFSPGTYIGTVCVSDPAATNSPQTVSITLNVYEPGKTAGPFGEFSTPVNDSVVSGSVPFTGWVLDDIGIRWVQLFRETGNSLAYIGDALLVEGARPDVEQAYPGYPGSSKAGWGYMMLTNLLPGGDGTFTIHAVAEDMEGHRVTLGKKTVIVNNAGAVKPFGAIDTPTQGGTAGGKEYLNYGWVLTPLPNAIPEDGSTMGVWVDGVFRGNPVYNLYREDIAGLFPGYANAGGAGGMFSLNTTAFKNGVHTIAWSAEDNAGNVDGIGSRFFIVKNNLPFSASSARCRGINDESNDLPVISEIPVDLSAAVEVEKGYGSRVGPEMVYGDDSGIITVKIHELERVVFYLTPGNGLQRVAMGFREAGKLLAPLPFGSTLDTERGIFYWQPGPGFVGNYSFVFILQDQKGNNNRVSIKVTIFPLSESSNRIEPDKLIRIDRKK